MSPQHGMMFGRAAGAHKLEAYKSHSARLSWLRSQEALKQTLYSKAVIGGSLPLPRKNALSAFFWL